MRIGVLADIHGNIDALKSVMREARDLSIDKFLIAGDFVGYYYHPGEVIDLVMGYEPIAVKGNHEILLEEFHDYDEENKLKLRSKYGFGIQKAHSELTSAQKQWLVALRENMVVELSGRAVSLCHGTPWDINEYMYEDSPKHVWRKFSLVESEIIIMGHAHHPFCKRMFDKIILNPGSVGQPRNGTKGANWALVDTETLKVEMMDSAYDKEKVASEAVAIDPEVPYLRDVLMRGRAK